MYEMSYHDVKENVESEVFNEETNFPQEFPESKKMSFYENVPLKD